MISRDELARIRATESRKAQRRERYRANWTSARDEAAALTKKPRSGLAGRVPERDHEAEAEVLRVMAQATRPMERHQVVALASPDLTSRAPRIREAVHALRRSGALVEVEHELFALAPGQQERA